jgi:hypothetical protein
MQKQRGVCAMTQQLPGQPTNTPPPASPAAGAALLLPMRALLDPYVCAEIRHTPSVNLHHSCFVARSAPGAAAGAEKSAAILRLRCAGFDATKAQGQLSVTAAWYWGDAVHGADMDTAVMVLLNQNPPTKRTATVPQMPCAAHWAGRRRQQLSRTCNSSCLVLTWRNKLL